MEKKENKKHSSHIEVLDGKLSIESYHNIVYKRASIEISEDALKRVDKAKEIIDQITSSNKVVYGINTGFGVLASKKIEADQLRQLQYNLIRSHSVGFGDPAPYNIVRGTMVLRLNSMLAGNSGISRQTLLRLKDAINANVYPFVPVKGSLGASGDLAPLAHIILALIGEGEFIEDGRRVNAKSYLEKRNLKPIELSSKEGLALINGTPYMSAWYLHNIFEAEKLQFWADFCGGFSIENLNGTLTPFKPEIQNVRPHRGQIDVAKRILGWFSESRRIESHKSCSKVQDAYALRCIPQVHGAVLNAIYDCIEMIKVEMNSVTDNPLIFGLDKIYSQGNFHGEILALYADFLSIAISELASISERRIERLLNPALSGLPGFLVNDAGLNSGLMITQYTAASLVSYNKTLAHPASVDSIPVSANQEDHVSMGANAVIKCNEIIKNTFGVIAIELLSNLFAQQFYNEDYSLISTFISDNFKEMLNLKYDDHPYYKDIEKIIELMNDDEFFQKLKEKFDDINITK